MAEDIRTFGYDNLLGGLVDKIVAKGIFVQGGGVYTRGTVLALVSVENGVETLTPVLSTATGDLASPYAVLADVVIDTSKGKVPAAAYFTGEFSPAGLVFQGTDTVDTFVEEMRKNNLFVKTTL